MAARQLMTFTDKAIKRLQTIKGTQENALGVKVHLQEMGCSGLSYKLDIALDKPKGFEHIKLKDSEGTPLDV